jgi:hypothetical protein
LTQKNLARSAKIAVRCVYMVGPTVVTHFTLREAMMTTANTGFRAAEPDQAAPDTTRREKFGWMRASVWLLVVGVAIAALYYIFQLFALDLMARTYGKSLGLYGAVMAVYDARQMVVVGVAGLLATSAACAAIALCKRRCADAFVGALMVAIPLAIIATAVISFILW